MTATPTVDASDLLGHQDDLTEKEERAVAGSTRRIVHDRVLIGRRRAVWR